MKSVEEEFKELQKTLDMSNYKEVSEQVMKDLMLFGKAVIKDGKCINPMGEEQ